MHPDWKSMCPASKELIHSWENMNQDKKIDCKVLQKFNPE
jgi:hypothetical protein